MLLDKAVSMTGTRKGMTPPQRLEFRRLLRGASNLAHGDCIGADADAHEIALEEEVPIEIWPSTASTRAYCKGYTIIHEPGKPLERNKDIVHSGAVLIGCPDGYERLRSGTWACIRYARRLKRPIYIIYPDGRVETENIA